MKKYKADQARKLRTHMAWMLAGHIIFTFLEVFYYEFDFILIFCELLYMWVCYYSYMTLNKWMCYFYILLMIQAPVSGMYHVYEIAGTSAFKPLLFTL